MFHFLILFMMRGEYCKVFFRIYLIIYPEIDFLAVEYGSTNYSIRQNWYSQDILVMVYVHELRVNLIIVWISVMLRLGLG